MTQEYFKKVPNFEYISRDSNNSPLSDYTEVKNLFKRAKIRDDIFQNLSYFEKYTIVGEERPDDVAYKFYDDPTLDWVILLANNIQNLYDEWPKSQSCQNEYLLEKYGSYDNLYNGIHHYETINVTDYLGKLIIEKGVTVTESYYNAPEFIVETDKSINLPITVPGIPAQISAQASNGRLTNLTLVSTGLGYTGSVEVFISPPNDPVQALVEFELNDPPANREVGDFTIIDSGSGYTVQPAITFSDPEETIPCQLEAVIDGSGALTSINILNPGEGYTFLPTITIDTPSDIFSNAILDTTSTLTVEASGWEGFYLDPSGTRAYTCHGNNSYTEGIVEYYTFNSSFDISNGTKISELDLSSSFEYLTGIEFRPDGSRFYVTGLTSSGFFIHQYNLSARWNITTATLSGTFAISECAGIRFRDTGSSFFVVDLANPDTIKEYELYDDWNINATFANPVRTVDINDITGESSVRGFSFKDDGSKMFVSGTDTNSVHILELSTNWDLGTLTLIGSKNTSSEDSIPLDAYMDPTETVIITGGSNTNKFYAYDTDIRATATAVLGIGTTSEQVTDIIVTKQGSGYSQENPPSVTIQPPVRARRAVGFVLIDNNQVKDIIITDPGYNYKSPPTAVIDEPLPRITAKGYATVQSGKIVQIALTNPGFGYTTNPTVTLSDPGPLYQPEKDEIFISNGQEWKYDGFDWTRRLSYGTLYTDTFLNSRIEVPGNKSSIPVTNFMYEERLETKKRSIFILKREYLNLVLDDIESIMEYKKGSEQYVSRTLKRGYNPFFFN
jgi:hypothetical protein